MSDNTGADPNDTARCPRCGAEFTTTTSPLGLCPACLLQLGMSDPAGTPVPESAAFAAPVPPPAPLPVSSRRSRPPRLAWVMAAAALAIVVVGVLAFLRPRGGAISPLPTAVRFTLPLPDETEWLEGAQFAVAPDGTQVALAVRSPDGQPRLWVRRLESLEWRELPGTEGAAFPFWSPDSRHVGFFADQRLRRIEVANGLTQTVCDAALGGGGTWGSQGVIVFAASREGPLFLVPASGGTPQQVTQLDRAGLERAHLWPQVLPDGRHVAFRVDAVGKGDNTGIYLADLETGERTKIASGRGSAAFAGDHLLFLRGTTLVAQGLDAARAELVGDVQAIIGADNSTFSASSQVLVHRSGEKRLSELTWFDRQGRVVGVAGTPADYQGFSLSPDGRSLAVARTVDGTSSVWLMELERDRLSRLTLGPAPGKFPVWSPDGARIAFVSRRDEADGVYTVAASGGGKEESLLHSPESKHPTDWSRDGRFLIYTATSPRTGSDLWTLPLSGDRKPQPVFMTTANESQARLSPDVRWVAYVSDESGREEVYVRPFPSPEGRWQISSGGGTRPQWRGDGRELYFVSADGQLMVVDFVATPAPRAGVPQSLFSLRRAGDFAVAPDGARFLVQMPVDEPGGRQLQVVVNWMSELRR
jgi:Tol biopolymer transport system component